MASTVNNIIVRERCLSHSYEVDARKSEFEDAKRRMTPGFASMIQDSWLVAAAVNRATARAC